MRLSNEEIVFLTSTSRGRTPLGVKYRISGKQQEKDKFIDKTFEILKQKNIVDDNYMLTMDGAELLFYWETYRNCEKHIVIDDTLTLAILPNSYIMVLCPVEDEYLFHMFQPETLMIKLLEDFPFLCEKDNSNQKGKWENINIDVWKEKIDSMEKNLFISEYKDGIKINDKVYCYETGIGYLLNLTTKRVRTLSGGAMRRQIYRMIGGE